MIGVRSVVLGVKSYVGHQLTQKPQLLFLVLPLGGNQNAFEDLLVRRALIKRIIKETILPQWLSILYVFLKLFVAIDNHGANPDFFSLTEHTVREIQGAMSHILQHDSCSRPGNSAKGCP